MNKEKLYDDFFNLIKFENPVHDSEYIKIQSKIEALSDISHIANMSFYVTDYYRKNFLYVSSNPLFLCGYDREDVKKMGYSFFLKIVPDEDLSMFTEINKKVFEYF